MQNKPKEAKNFLKWYEDWLNRANKVTFRLRLQDLDPKESYRRHFKKAIDFYDQSDEYVKTELVFRELYNLRERCAERLDISQTLLLSNDAVLVFARQRPTTLSKFNAVLKKFSIVKNDEQMAQLREL